ncbi:MAG: flagellar basal body-associated FliL family protein [Treponema sp.]|nr:flagellar basal body-associated FliL family protein [Candidatus Treponema scatequi]
MKISLDKILIYIIAGLGALTLFCTVTTFLAGKASFNTYRKGDPQDISEIKTKDSVEILEFKFGTLRALTAPEKKEFSNGTNLVVTPWLTYTSKDSAFYEELVQKKQTLTNIFMNYFATRTQKELFTLGEKKIKAELLELINDELILGKIEAVYFDDYIFLD